MSRLEIPQSLDAWVVTYYFPDTPVQSLNITGAPNRILMERPPRLIFTVFSDAKASTSPRDGKSPIPPRYDGAKSSFGDIGVSATVANLDQLSTFAAQRSTDEALTVMVINKDRFEKLRRDRQSARVPVDHGECDAATRGFDLLPLDIDLSAALDSERRWHLTTPAVDKKADARLAVSPDRPSSQSRRTISRHCRS